MISFRYLSDTLEVSWEKGKKKGGPIEKVECSLDVRVDFLFSKNAPAFDRLG
jgi:hypothetical protein